ncbi:MAG: hypothetical protein ACKVOU_09085 [Cytophagales bacterium]
MQYLQIVLISLVFLLKLKAQTSKDVISYAGQAFTIKPAAFFYQETHNEIIVNGKHCKTDVAYTNELGEKIGYKTLDYTKYTTSPTYKLEDNRAKYREGAEITPDGKVIVYFQYTDKEITANFKTFSVPQPIVIDGGFNYFVKENWNAIINGSILTFNFVSPSKMDYFTFRISKKADIVYNRKQATLLYLELDNMILRWLIPPIKITYDIKTKRIIKYEGIANLSDKNGKNEIVSMVFPILGP